MGWYSAKSAIKQWPQEIPTFVASDSASALAVHFADVLADRRNSPNLTAQLEAAAGRSIDAVICSVLDGDLRLPLNAAVAARWGPQVVAGVLAVIEKSRARRGLIVIDAGAPAEWTGPLHHEVQNQKLSIVEIPNSYPQADPTMLAYALTGHRLKPFASPTALGIILLDAAAALAMSGAKTSPLGILDHRSGKATFMDVPAAMTLSDALAAARVPAEGAILRGGDLLRDIRLSIGKSVGRGELAIHVLPARVARIVQPCIRCGWCADVCPTGVSPAWLLEADQRHNLHLAQRGGLAACIECGLCDQVCPSSLPLLDAIRQLKQT